MRYFCPNCGRGAVAGTRSRVAWCGACRRRYGFALTPSQRARRTGPHLGGRPLPAGWRLCEHENGVTLRWRSRREGDGWAAALMFVSLLWSGAAAGQLAAEPAVIDGAPWPAFAVGGVAVVFLGGLLLALRDLLSGGTIGVGESVVTIGRRRVRLAEVNCFERGRPAWRSTRGEPRLRVVARLRNGDMIPVAGNLRGVAEADFLAAVLNDAVRRHDRRCPWFGGVVVRRADQTE